MYRKLIIFLVFIFEVLSFNVFAGTLKFNTSLSFPNGFYQKMNLVPFLATDSTPNPCPAGMMFIKQQAGVPVTYALYICDGTGTASVISGSGNLWQDPIAVTNPYSSDVGKSLSLINDYDHAFWRQIGIGATPDSSSTKIKFLIDGAISTTQVGSATNTAATNYVVGDDSLLFDGNIPNVVGINGRTYSASSDYSKQGGFELGAGGEFVFGKGGRISIGRKNDKPNYTPTMLLHLHDQYAGKMNDLGSGNFTDYSGGLLFGLENGGDNQGFYAGINTSTNDAYIAWRRDDNTPFFKFKNFIKSPATNTDIMQFNWGSDDSYSGNVSIGTSKIVERLTVGGEIRGQSGEPADNNANVGYGFTNKGGTGMFSIGDSAINFAVDANPILKLRYVQNDDGVEEARAGVGLGGEPVTKLDVNGEIKVSWVDDEHRICALGAIQYSGNKMEVCVADGPNHVWEPLPYVNTKFQKGMHCGQVSASELDTASCQPPDYYTGMVPCRGTSIATASIPHPPGHCPSNPNIIWTFNCPANFIIAGGAYSGDTNHDYKWFFTCVCTNNDGC
ncbi:MAG: hypothetical protein HQL25_09000 [Candidatus Omnitrophica bacterium]|nr:hypothetical protein [Candidatus Omnitrophota bacterium]